MTASFGRRPAPEGEEEPAAPVEIQISPVLNADALAALMRQVRSAVADSVEAGFVDGIRRIEEESAMTDHPTRSEYL
jgi:hypothetical protein